jgi:DNA-binding response OmpR family regulator
MRILLVEDENKVAALVRKALEEEGHVVEVAQDGEAGLMLAQDSPVDLVILDWLLPGRDGLAVCRSLRNTGAKIPILMLTARDAVEYRIQGLDAGADD